jgi:hypothetical protein
LVHRTLGWGVGSKSLSGKPWDGKTIVVMNLKNYCLFHSIDLCWCCKSYQGKTVKRFCTKEGNTHTHTHTHTDKKEYAFKDVLNEFEIIQLQSYYDIYVSTNLFKFSVWQDRQAI